MMGVVIRGITKGMGAWLYGAYMLFPVNDAGLDASNQLFKRLELVPGRRRISDSTIGK
jgi:hypothetical protein